MATTLTASFFYQDRLYIGHVGDCRTYRVRDRRIQSLTTDHAIGRHTLTRTIGAEPDVEVDVYEVTPRAGDLYVQCSDGLYGMVSDQEIMEVASQNPPQKSCDELIRLANHYGGADNITVQVIYLS